jgi:hypothetical protein
MQSGKAYTVHRQECLCYLRLIECGRHRGIADILIQTRTLEGDASKAQGKSVRHPAEAAARTK